MIIDYYIELPVGNPLKFTYLGQADNERASFDQRRFSQVVNASTEEDRYYQIFENADTPLTQVYTNFLKKRIVIIDCEGNEINPMPFDLVRKFTNKVFASNAKFATKAGKLFIFFQETTIGST